MLTDTLHQAFGFFYQFADAFAFLVLSGLGLAVIFGMMGVINLAHGELIMFGAYMTVLSARAGMPLPLAMVLGTLAAAVAGLILERLVVRRLYNRLFDSIVATWAVSTIATQGMLMFAGPSLEGLKTPFGSFQLGALSFSTYRALLPLVALLLLLGVYLLLMHTRFGIRARATIANPDMARALGVNTSQIYSMTFALGAGLAGLTGALYAPTMTSVPTMGQAFIVQSFVTVVVGGSDVLVGVAPAAAALGLIQAGLTASSGQLIGQIGLLVAVIIVVRVLPNGISGWLLRRGG